MRLLDCKREGAGKFWLTHLLFWTIYVTTVLTTSQRCAYLDALSVNYVLNPKLVQGFDYYTRTVFEVTYAGLGRKSAIGAGGRYDGLVEEVGTHTPAVGFAVGVERLLLALESEGGFKAAALHARCFCGTVWWSDEDEGCSASLRTAPGRPAGRA